MTSVHDTNVSRNIKLALFISFQIPSIISHMFIIYHLISNRILRRALHNHVILVLLIINFLFITTDLSITFHFLRFGFIKKTQGNLCLAWNFLDSFLSNLSTFLMMWASIERNILVFYDRQLLNTSYKRFFFHYLPLIILIIYTFIFYLIVIFLNSSCSNIEYFIYDELFCGKPCYIHKNIILSSIDYLFHKIFSSILIFIFSFILLIRFLWGKRQRNQTIRWRQHRKITIQFISISILYFLGTIPVAISELLHIWKNLSNNVKESEIQEEIFLYFFYFISLILPFVCLLNLPEIYSKIPLFIYFKRQLNIRFITRRNQIAVMNTIIQRKTTNML
ncbi:unnamed protein product [Rotaria sp. Silwood2]|nr:unnamed protein product [Rotaria sp. Silwood2]CAF3087449.1 unnamed protein product [Rotaria sp. Silwood2]CAF3240465.1 unnamed protein product [Rotaria sp. Silwood2]CAF4086015.1 unnamed protein product [Rotaria sp. Silwood2]CAF4208364.1 unnamed protein product [Rotaria sp. Silwood2]